MENLRVSSYVIPVKLEIEPDKYMLIHGYTGAIDIVNQKIVSFLQAKMENSQQGIPDDCLRVLQQRGYLTDRNVNEEYEHVSLLAEKLHKRENLLSKNYLFIVTYDCNFRCPYCFEHVVSKSNMPLSNQTFTKEMVDAAYGCIMQMEKENPRQDMVITLYGGEPLLAKNRNIVQYIVEQGSSHGFKFFAVTNGYDLDAYKDLLNEKQIYSLQITIDGTKDCHDSRRVHYLEGSSFDKILRNVGMALQQGVRIMIRINTDKIILPQLEELYRHFEGLGFVENPLFSIQSAFLRNHKTTGIDNLDFLSFNEYFAFHKKCDYKYGCQFQYLYKNILKTLEGKERLQFRSTHCMSQHNGYLFDPVGNIYSCWNCVGKDDNVIGTYDRSGFVLNEICGVWHSYDIRKREKCLRCKYALLCGGGCLGRAEFTGKQFKRIDCGGFPTILKYMSNRAYNKYIGSHCLI